MAGRVGFEPTTSSLEGWLAIRAATLAQQLERKMDVQVLRFPIGLTREEEIFLKVIRTAPRTLSGSLMETLQDIILSIAFPIPIQTLKHF